MNTTRVCFTQLKKARVGDAFKSIEEIKTFFDQFSWSVKDLVNPQANTQELPSKAEVSKLLRLSGLPQIKDTPQGNKELQEMQKNLATQITFINKLQSIELPDEANINPQHARIMPRKAIKPYTLKDLLAPTHSTEPEDTQNLGEQTNSWDATSLASNTKNSSDSAKHKFFVLREGLIKNRE